MEGAAKGDRHDGAILYSCSERFPLSFMICMFITRRCPCTIATCTIITSVMPFVGI